MSDLRTGLKALAFVLVTGLLTGAVGLALAGNPGGETATYRAVFTDISGLATGSRVRAAGVAVGAVDEIELRADSVLVTFTASESLPLTESTRAVVRYKNLIGDRYLELAPGPVAGSGPAAPLAPGGVIPATQTTPALDLTALFTGFRPLVEALSPQQVNRLTRSVIAVFQGQGATVNSLLSHIASLTSTLADRDQVIGRLIDNLNTVLATVDERRAQFSALVTNLQQLVSGLAADRFAIGESLEQIDTLSAETAGLLRVLRPEFTATVAQTGRLAGALNSRLDTLDRTLQRAPGGIQRAGRAGAYGSFFNFYLCGFGVRLSAPGTGTVQTPAVGSEVPRCRTRGGGDE